MKKNFKKKIKAGEKQQRTFVTQLAVPLASVLHPLLCSLLRVDDTGLDMHIDMRRLVHNSDNMIGMGRMGKATHT